MHHRFPTNKFKFGFSTLKFIKSLFVSKFIQQIFESQYIREASITFNLGKNGVRGTINIIIRITKVYDKRFRNNLSLIEVKYTIILRVMNQNLS